MKVVPLSQGLVALVDDSVFASVNLHKWHADRREKTIYARARIAGSLVYLHRWLVNAPDSAKVNHWDGNGLHNWFDNLRVCTNAQNVRYQILPRQGKRTSRFKGVSWYRRDQCWRAYIVLDACQKHLGYFDDEVEAAKAYDAAAQKLFGDFAALNFPDASH